VACLQQHAFAVEFRSPKEIKEPCEPILSVEPQALVEGSTRVSGAVLTPAHAATAE